MRKRSFVLISVLLVCSFILCGCAVGLNSKAREQFSELNESVKESKEELQGLKVELEALNKNLADLKTILSTNLDKLDLAELAAIMKRIADALEALNSKAQKVLGK